MWGYVVDNLEKVSRKDAKALRNAIIGLNGLDIGTQMTLIGEMNADKCGERFWV